MWPVAQQSKELFAPFMRRAIRAKVEASPFPAEAKTEAVREEYLERYRARMGIEMSLEDVCPNDGLRHCGKALIVGF